MPQYKFLDKMIIQLRHYREANQLSQTQMAEILKIGARSYQRYENGESVPSVDFIYMASKVLKFKVSDLFSPEEVALQIDGFRICKPEEKLSFEADPLVQGSGLVAFTDSFAGKQVTKTGDLTLLKKMPEFMDCPYPLTVSNPKATFLNKAAQAKSGFIFSHLVATQTGSEDIKSLGIVWATLIEKGNTYFTYLKHAQMPNGRMRLDGRHIFRADHRSYVVFGVIDITPAVGQEDQWAAITS